jgi:hypothetical protein
MIALAVGITPLSVILASLPKSVELGTMSTAEVNSVSTIEDTEDRVSEAVSRSLWGTLDSIELLSSAVTDGSTTFVASKVVLLGLIGKSVVVSSPSETRSLAEGTEDDAVDSIPNMSAGMSESRAVLGAAASSPVVMEPTWLYVGSATTGTVAETSRLVT